MDEELNQEVRDYYRTVSRFIDRERADAPDAGFWERLAAEHRGGSGLDLGCGTGRVTATLAAALGFVAGVDLSPEMLARALPASRGRGGGPGFHLVAADLRRLRLRRRFDLVVAANDPLAHVGEGNDRDRVLAAVAEHLASDGRFVLDAHWFSADRLRRALAGDGLVEEHAGEGIEVRETWHCRTDGSCHARYEYLRDGERLNEASFDSRYWTLGEVRDRFGRAGLRVSGLWGDYDRSPWREETSRHLIVEARRV